MGHTFTFIDTQKSSNTCEPDLDSGEERVLKVRLDKWLWAARFFKTRALARLAVETKKVTYWINGQQISKLSPSREIEVGAVLTIQHGRFIKTIIIKGLSTRRRSTEEALQLFEETEESRVQSEILMVDPLNYGNFSPGIKFTEEEEEET